MKPVQERIFLYKDDELVTFASLTEEEKDRVRTEINVRAIETYMGSLGYKRVGEIHTGKE